MTCKKCGEKMKRITVAEGVVYYFRCTRCDNIVMSKPDLKRIKKDANDST